eukprot:CAMPEP_0170253448 /NCGR_PEP_ID=MMETSP0116_2-20130129/26564_1 /TAXON_ID=400756 /ORGANISM="Durinskia baltica, Strain CSIRO CS-38" /LENGTH=244 /DNA_ID=CAMNT_0010504431 /DNA_START=88 /DNA_END=822 /DNA_ORIENTATION=-
MPFATPAAEKQIGWRKWAADLACGRIQPLSDAGPLHAEAHGLSQFQDQSKPKRDAGAATAAAVAAAAAASGGTPEMRLVVGTSGSEGHPWLCGRPCVFFARGECKNAFDCMYCHMEHPDRRKPLDKHRRKLLGAMSQGEAASIILPAVRQAIDAVLPSPGAAAAFDALARSCVPHVGIPMHPTISQEARGNLMNALKKLQLPTLLAALRRYGLRTHRDAVIASFQLLDQVRATSAASQTSTAGP